MKLSPAFLAYKLSSAFSVLAPENLPLSGTLELPVLYQTGSAATAHRVFLCTEEQIGSLSSLPEESSSLFSSLYRRTAGGTSGSGFDRR